MSNVYSQDTGREITSEEAIRIMDAYADIYEPDEIYLDDEGYNPCDGCGGEDCVCCEVWHERQADFEYENGYY